MDDLAVLHQHQRQHKAQAEAECVGLLQAQVVKGLRLDLLASSPAHPVAALAVLHQHKHQHQHQHQHQHPSVGLSRVRKVNRGERLGRQV